MTPSMSPAKLPRALSLLLCTLTLWAAPLARPQPMAPAQQPISFEGREIVEIRVEGLQSVSPETILFYLGLEEGQRLDEEKLNESIQSLWQRRLVDDVTVEGFASGDDGVVLVVRVVERPMLLSVDYEGMKRISRTDITDRILRDNVQIMEQTPLSIGELERVKKIIEELYEEKGYRFAEARYTLDEIEPNRFAVVFSVDEGDRVRIGEVDFRGNEVLGELHLQWLMKTKETNLINRLFKRDIYNPAKLEEDLEKIRQAYRRRGYKNVVIGDPEIEVVARRPDAPTLAKQKRRMFLTIPIDEGDRWRLGEISIDGNERFSDQQLLRVFQHKPGGWYRSKKIDQAIETISELYQNSGYIFALVEPELKEREENVADLLLHISEREQFTIGRIEFEGNIRTRDKVLRRELRVQEGLLMNSGALRNSVQRVNQLGYFQLDQEEPVSIDVDSEDKEVNLVFKGEEADRTELQFGGGWSETFGFEGNFSMRTRNFRGRGETLGIQFQRGRFRDAVDVSYFIPWFLDRPQLVGLRVFDLNINFDLATQEFEQDQKGFQLTYGRNLRLFQRFNIVYLYSDRNDVFRIDQDLIPDDPEVPLPPEFFLRQVDRTFASVQPTWIYDSRDNPFEPTRGRRLMAAVEVAGSFLGGDNELIRPRLEFTLFKPLTRQPLTTVFAINTEAGWLTGFPDQTGCTTNPSVNRGVEVCLSPFERFYLGGENSVRGHRVNTLFVRDEFGQRVLDPQFLVPLGGDTFFQLNLEYHAVLGGPLRLLWFFDAGNVFSSDHGGIDLGNLRTTTGVELRVLVPVFGAPLRFIYAVNLDELPEFTPDGLRIVPDDFETFQFNIGTSF